MRFTCGALLLLWSGALAALPTGVAQIAEVSFANSGRSDAQPEFIQGLTQLHNFEYEDAAAHFHAAQTIDPAFAMAYWGEAMTRNHGIWHEQDLDAAREVLSRLGATPADRRAKAPTQREKDYLGTLEILYGEGSKEERDQKYAAAMERLHENYPKDIDATALYALAILSSAEHGRDFAIYMRAAAVLEAVFPLHPHHPGVVHYLIHSYDDPIHAPLGLRPARIYAQIAPDAGHAQHMTSHIFLALGMWDEVVKANEAARAVVNSHRAVAGRQPAECGHYNEWLEYGYLQLGRVPEARHLLESCRDRAQRPGRMDFSAINSYAVMRAHFLISAELWSDEVAGWTLAPGEFPMARLAFDYTDTLVTYHRGDLGAAHKALLRVEGDVQPANASLQKMNDGEPTEQDNVAVLVSQLRALLSTSPGSARSVSDALEAVAAKEGEIPLEFGPPAIFKPTEEMLGELYLQQHRTQEARKAFAADLARAPGRRLGVQGLARAQQ